ncbi:hypothetical protein Anapl_02106 [Anas platyrhynchos]|uniref:Uncharacterized protein n=1 Tax=Anas platyrhynchos TaxID=8839 RepID=R0K607_ANAPL|nr:hypothetical protein Anapl_02106 [Anas platyrhynchos]
MQPVYRADGGFGTLSLPEKTFRSCKQQPGQAQLLAVFLVWELGAAVPSIVGSPGAVDSFQLCLRVYFVLSVPAEKRALGKIPAGRSGGGSVHTHRHWAASAGGEGLCSDQCPHGPAGCWRCAVLQDQPRVHPGDPSWGEPGAACPVGRSQLCQGSQSEGRRRCGTWGPAALLPGSALSQQPAGERRCSEPESGARAPLSCCKAPPSGALLPTSVYQPARVQELLRLMQRALLPVLRNEAASLQQVLCSPFPGRRGDSCSKAGSFLPGEIGAWKNPFCPEPAKRECCKDPKRSEKIQF